jgi:WbqC-like protein family
MTTVAIHQPNFLPWLGYFQKIYASDIFIFHDAVEFTKRSFTQRVCIRKTVNSDEKIYLTVPLQKHSDYEQIKNLQVASNEYWQTAHLNKIKNVYRKAPFFELYFPQLEAWFLLSKTANSFADMNIQLIINILDILKIKRIMYRSAEMGFPLDLKADKGIAWLVEKVGGSTYLSGEGARKYQQEQTFIDKNIDLKYAKYGAFLMENHPPQYQGTPIYGLSVIDALFNIGAAGILNHFKQFDLYTSDNALPTA